MSKNVDFRQIAERTPGFSGADLSNLMNEAAILTAKKNLTKVSMDELIPSIEKVLLGPERKSRILSDNEKRIAAYHEAAHALVNSSLPNTDVVRKISIISRGRAAGYTLKLPTEDKHLHTKTEFIEELAVLLAGYTVEKIVFNELTTGASNDLDQATKLARRLVMRYGMSEKLGARTFGEEEEMVFLGREIVTEKDYSEKVAAQIDEEVSKFIETAQKTAHEILTAKRPLLDKLADRLLEKETIEKEEFEKIISEA
jgi:cell division protease FtsH